MNGAWKVTLRLFRKKGDAPAYFQDFPIEVDPEEYLLDAIERIWAFEDRSLVFRHACHHSVCGACGMRVDGVEKLTCITPIHEIARDGDTIKVEPLRNFPVVSDLVVDMGAFYRRLEQARFRQVLPLSEAPAEGVPARPRHGKEPQDLYRLVDCIECGLCISACPIASTDPDFLGPAVLAAAQQTGVEDHPEILEWVDSAEGLWRCHSAYECTAVCPANVDPAWRIMDLRRRAVVTKVKRAFGWVR